MPGSHGDKFAKDCKRSKSVIGKIGLLLLGHAGGTEIVHVGIDI